MIWVVLSKDFKSSDSRKKQTFCMTLVRSNALSYHSRSLSLLRECNVTMWSVADRPAFPQGGWAHRRRLRCQGGEAVCYSTLHCGASSICYPWCIDDTHRKKHGKGIRKKIHELEKYKTPAISWVTWPKTYNQMTQEKNRAKLFGARWLATLCERFCSLWLFCLGGTWKSF